MLEEDLLLEIANAGGLKSMFETTSNLHTFWIKVKAEHTEIATKALKSLLLFPNPVFGSSVFCSDNHQNEITE